MTPFFASTESQESKSDVSLRNRTRQCALEPILRLHLQMGGNGRKWREMGGNQGKSEEIKGNGMKSGGNGSKWWEIGGNQRKSEEIRGNQSKSE